MDIQNSEGRIKCLQCFCLQMFLFSIEKKQSMCVRTRVSLDPLSLYTHFIEGS